MIVFASHLISTVINGLRPVANPNQTIELQPGQIFRGTIMKAYPNNIVQVQLAGSTLIAELNAPLAVGQQAWLQVMPKSHPITLKVIDTPRQQVETRPNQADSADKSSIEGLLRAIGQKADKSNIQNLQRLVSTGVPLKSEELGPMLQLLRSASAPDQTLQIIQIANQRGLPLNGEVIRSLEAVFFGKSLNEITQQITQIGQQSQQNQQTHNLILQLTQLWQSARSQLSQLPALSIPTASSQALGINAEASPTNVTQQSANPSQPILSQQQIPASTVDVFSNTSRVVHTSQQGPSTTSSTVQQGIQETVAISSNIPAELLSTKGNTPPLQNGLLNFLKILGVNYDSSISNHLGQPEVDSSTLKQDALSQLKGVLLELRGLENLTTAIREAVDHGIRMVTGQQLLLVNDTNAPWNSFIFHIPLSPTHREGESNYIHIEGRKKGRDAIDSENCRLFFHLDLQYLDTTMIDIQITSRIMNINIYNDLPLVKQWLEGNREEWKDAMLEHDYQLSSIKVLPISNADEQKVNPSAIPVQQSSYQGVDIRI